MAPISHELNLRGYKEYIVHTGQHFDENMSEVFFQELGIPKPDKKLEIGGGSHGKMTALMLMEIEEILMQINPKFVLIYGDTNSTLAAALAAVKLKIPMAHVESGPRIYDIDTPEEINRIVADHASRLRFCPDLMSVQNLAKENVTKGVYFTGDVMYDAYRRFSAYQPSKEMQALELNDEPFALMTIHRPNNTDSMEALGRLLELLRKSPMKIIFPMHPRTEAAFKKFGIWEDVNALQHVKIMPAVGYLDILYLVNRSKIVLTDSGGLQKEAFFAGKPTMILFYATPWPQIEESGWQKRYWKDNGIDTETILGEMLSYPLPSNKPNIFGSGDAAKKIVDILESKKWLIPRGDV
jgi:UDP-N-acetylglucosamine 2-epimerase